MGADQVEVDYEELNAARKRKGLTYQQLADATSLHKSMIGHLCTGRTVTCNRDTGKRIEDALDMPHGSLFRLPSYDTLYNRRGARAKKPLSGSDDE